MDLIESLNTLLDAGNHLVGQHQQGNTLEGHPMLADIQILGESAAVYLKTLDIEVTPFDSTTLAGSIERGEAPNSLELWVGEITLALSRIPNNTVDLRFKKFVEHINRSAPKALIIQAKNNYNSWSKGFPAEIVNGFIQFQKTYQFWGNFDPKANDYSMIEERVACLKEHIDDFVEMYYALGDYRSRLGLLSLLEYWLNFDIATYNRMQERHFSSYFDLDLMHCDSNEVLVDLGAFTGDTVIDYINNYGPNSYKKIYCYEINKPTLAILKKNLQKLPNIEICYRGAGEKKGTLFVDDDQPNAASTLKNSGKTAVDVVALDDDIAEPITFLKLDVEGAEYAALLGAQRHIVEELPKMAISIYHNNDDLWRIFKLISSMTDQYDYFFRFNAQGPESINPYPFPADYILLCVPKPQF